MKLFLQLIFWVLLPIFVGFFANDSLFTINRSPILNKFLIQTGNNQMSLSSRYENGLLNFSEVEYKSRIQTLFKIDDNVFIHIDGTGWVFKLIHKDSVSLVFKRIDKTENQNYNTNSIDLIWNKQIMNLGGYGYWRINGHLRYYNFTQKEWFIKPLNVEMTCYLNQFMNADPSYWFDGNNTLYKFCFIELNQGIKGKSELQNNSSLNNSFAVLDIKNGEWKQIGVLAFDPLKNKSVNEKIATTCFGNIVNIKGIYYLLDFRDNKVLKFKDESSIDKIHSLINYYKFASDSIIYFGSNIPNGAKYDSIIFRFSDFEQIGKIYSTPINWSYPIWGGLIILILILYLTRKHISKVFWAKINEADQIKRIHDLPVSLTFTESEKILLYLLYKNTINNLPTLTEDIDYVLGTTAKSYDNRKAYRSKIISSINSRYKLTLNKFESLIIRLQLDEYKKSYAYFLDKNAINIIKDYIEPIDI